MKSFKIPDPKFKIIFMIFQHIVPILYSGDIERSLKYYTEVLGFDQSWKWDDPPTFGGVSKNSVEIFFCKDGQGHPGTWLSVFVNDVDEFYETVKARGAKIISAPASMDWNVREMLVEDPDGHAIRFGANITENNRESSNGRFPSCVKIVARIPSAKEIQQLSFDVGWSPSPDEAGKETPSGAVVFSVVAEDTETGKMIGCAFLLGDNTGFYYVRNVMVHPTWQGKRVGTALMQEITDWLEKHAPDNSYIGLHTPQNLAPFYRQFGFAPAFGMFRQIRRNK
jgi:catechol 2,3-dioxygenase-like lactoylglutathione lyase family enzyme/GNAT superfamily N-acetyltransferase